MLIYQEQGNVDGMLSILNRMYLKYKRNPALNKTTLMIQNLIVTLLEGKDIKEAIKFLEKTIQHNGTACPLCESQKGIWSAIDRPIWGLGETISTVDEKGDTVVYVNNWMSNDGWDYHPQGKGTVVFRRVG